jgi:NAD(P)-dependent dehydrogenase (short-subunit alcohol dehydrogenase family)
MSVVLADMNPEVLDATVADLRGRGLAVSGVATDVADFDAVKRLADTAFDRHGNVHVLMCNAGTGGPASFFDGDMAAWNRAIGVNLQGTLHCILAFLPRMVEAGEQGHVLATTSGSGAQGTMYTGPAYASTKMAIVSLMESLYGQLRDRGSSIKAGLVFPPLTRSNMGSERVESYLQASGIPAVLAEPEELANVILDGILTDRFWINPTFEEDERYFGGRLKPNIEWQKEMVMRKAEAMVEQSPPDTYLWGPGGTPPAGR